MIHVIATNNVWLQIMVQNVLMSVIQIEPKFVDVMVVITLISLKTNANLMKVSLTATGNMHAIGLVMQSC